MGIEYVYHVFIKIFVLTMMKSLITMLLIFPVLYLPVHQHASISNFPYAPETWQQEMLRHVNKIRADGCQCGRKKMPSTNALKWNEKLANVAKKHAVDMDKNHFIGHYGSNGSRLGQRVDNAGYNWQCVAENVAWNTASIQGVVLGWKDSPGHCVNLMGGYKEMGAARLGAYWVQVFAAPMK